MLLSAILIVYDTGMTPTPFPAQSAEVLSKKARERKRDDSGRFDVEGRQAAQVDLSESDRLSLAAPSEKAGKPIHLTGSIGRKNRKSNPTRHQVELEQSIKKVFAAGGWQEVLKLRQRRGFHNYSISNRWRIANHSLDMGVDTPIVASKSDWEKRGRQMIPGAEGCPVMVPRHYSKEIEEEDENGDTVTHKVAGVAFRIGSGTEVYDITQTQPIEGVEDQTNTQAWGDVVVEQGVDPQQAREELERVIEKAGLSLREVSPNITRGALGSYSRKSGRVAIDKTLKPADAVAVMAHELGHHFDKSIEKNPEIYEKHRGDCETVAELTAMSVSMELGIDTKASSAVYLQNWNPEWTPGTVGWAKNVVERWSEAHSKIMGLLDGEPRAEAMPEAA